METTGHSPINQNTTHRVVIPFYVYAALSFLVATVLLALSTGAFTQHWFHPHTLAITHTMALGWGTMIILGASHQLVPVLIESKLYSVFLAHLSFVLAATGIPLLVYAFFTFQIDWTAKTGGILINAAVVSFLGNVAVSCYRAKGENVYASFVLTAACWLLVTTLIGLLLVYNFTLRVLPNDSLHYLSLHAHLGIGGWFLLLVTGVGSKLIPMFLISKYEDPKRLWLIYYLMNAGLAGVVLVFFFTTALWLYFVPVTAVLTGLLLFAIYCRDAYRQRIRKQVDGLMKLSLLSVCMMAIPFVLLLMLLVLLFFYAGNAKLVLAYGFSIFFGWLTAIILGMTFKTLPFIVWNKVYHRKAGLGKTPNPKDLFNASVFNTMGVAFLAGFVFFAAGIFLGHAVVLQVATILLLVAAILYNWNVIRMLFHQPEIK